MSQNSPILITGCQRSGTTLLSLILDSHPEIHGIDEMDFESERMPEYLEDPRYHPVVAFKQPSLAHTVRSFKALAGLKVLWCIRDPRDVVASMLNLQLPLTADDALSWALHPLGGVREIHNCAAALGGISRELKDLLEIYVTIQQGKKRDRQSEVLSAALCWRLKQEVLALYPDEGMPYRVVRYESLIDHPRAELEKLFADLGVSWHDDVLQHHRKHAGDTVGETDSSRAIDNRSRGKWAESLSADDVAIIQKVCGPVAPDAGYVLDGEAA